MHKLWLAILYPNVVKTATKMLDEYLGAVSPAERMGVRYNDPTLGASSRFNHLLPHPH